MKPIHAGLILLLVVSSLCAQENSLAGAGTASAHATTAVLEGLVTKDPGSEPVKKTLIELIAEEQSHGANYTAVTGADGMFHIDGILPGRYRLFVERSGYLEVDKHQAHADGRVLALTAGQELKDVSIRLQAAAVVEGRVTDEDGDPLPNAQVSVQRQTFVLGRRHWEQAGAGTANDLGDYRIANLPAGTYFVSVTPPPDFKSLIESSDDARAAHRTDASSKAAPTSYALTYYPGTRDRGQAVPVQLHAGDNFPANFSLTLSPSLTVRGSIANVPPGTSAVVMLQSKEFSTVLNGADIHKDGSFEIHDVSPGAYTLLAMVDSGAAPMVARQTVQVASENVEGLRLVPQTGAWVRGHMQFENRNGAGRSGPSRIDTSQFFLALRPVDGEEDVLGALSLGEGFTTLAHVSADGSFEWKDVPPGHYYVQLSGDGDGQNWYLKSMTAGSRDAGDSSLVVNSGSMSVDVLASANGAAVEGVVSNAKGGPVANAVVVAAPEARFRRRIDRFRKTVSDQSGRFTLRGLPPGQYTIFAWDSVDGEAYYNPEFLKTYEGQGRVLDVGEGERKSVQLEAVPAEGEEVAGP